MENKDIKYVIFDFDGTIADSGGIAFNAINRMSEKHGFDKLDWSQVDKLRSMTLKERSKYMGVPLYKMPLIVPEFYSYYKEEMIDMGINEGIRELLDNLNEAGYKLAVISSNSEHNIKEFFAKEDIKIFKDIICSKRIFSKDKIINKFLKNKRLNPSEVIYIGDETRDIEACQKSGIKIIWVDWGLDMREAAAVMNPDYMVSKTEEIYKIIKSLGG